MDTCTVVEKLTTKNQAIPIEKQSIITTGFRFRMVFITDKD